MTLKLAAYGIDGDDGAELEELLWSIPEISEIRTRWRTRDSVPLGTIHASAAPTVMTFIISYVVLKFTDEAIKDAYKLWKEALLERLNAWRDEKNENVEVRHRTHFASSESGELVVCNEASGYQP